MPAEIAPPLAPPAEAAPPIDEAYYGLAGEIVHAIEPHSEADPRAILTMLLVAFGNAVGRGPYFQVEGTQHHMNLNLLVVGETAKSRKGTAWGQVRRLFPRDAGVHDPLWSETRILDGLSSGEGLIWAVRDPTSEEDAGVADKRLLVVEEEFVRPLKAMARQGSVLSPVIRSAWDGLPKLAILTKNFPARATSAHISIIAQITLVELRNTLTSTELGNGFANRFLFALVHRSKLLPTGGNLTDEGLQPLIRRLYDVRVFARSVGRIRFDSAAHAYWCEVYPALSEGKPGLAGAVTARAEAQVIRLACLYALLDRSATVRVEHLRAALAVWAYSEASAQFVFSDMTGNEIADGLLAKLRAAGEAGMSETQIRNSFGHHHSEGVDRALILLERLGLVRCIKEPTAGRPVTRWLATKATKAPTYGAPERQAAP